jgi:predicted PurR-regulated permease PerM
VLALDDRTGNVLTTIGLFAAVAAIVYATRPLIVVSVLGLLLAYLLEPSVAWVQGRLPGRSHSRASAIAVVYLSGTIVVIGAGYALGPAIAGQLQRFRAAAPGLLARVTDGGFFGEHRSALVAETAKRTGGDVAAAAGEIGWLLLVPIVAVFFLNNRESLIDSTVSLFARWHERARVTRTLERIDTMLAQYTRAQLTLAALVVAFYSGSMAVLGLPYPLALGLLAGALEFIPVVGWLIAAAVILTTGWIAHAPWMWMAGLIAAWKIVENFVLSPRIMGDRLQLEPMTVIFALMAGGQIGGLLGAVLSVPVVAVLHILWSERAPAQSAAVALMPSTSAPMSNS